MNALYTAASGLIANQLDLTAVANNLSNAQTPGYLMQNGQFTAFPKAQVERVENGASHFIGTASQGVAFNAQWNSEPGGTVSTGRPTDLAIAGHGFFAVQDGAQIAYTRDGRFTRNDQGNLVTPTGQRLLLSSGKPLVLGTGAFSVT
ncbi:MAG: flagellar hook-basal body complex protein, partial [Firmicutes bacterium]|nr:flagellar hook-basal body complex protein [Bacillota bacterium]